MRYLEDEWCDIKFGTVMGIQPTAEFRYNILRYLQFIPLGYHYFLYNTHSKGNGKNIIFAVLLLY